MKLLKMQKNNLYDIIEQTNYFHPSQFQISEGDNLIKVNFGEDYYFQINCDKHGNIYFNYSPGYSSYTESSGVSDWHNLDGYFDQWLGYLNIEVDAPDKWEMLLKELKYLNFSNPEDNQSFSHPEYLEISAKFTTIKASLNDLDLDQNQLEIINKKLDHLLEMTNKLGKFDWKSLFIGTIVSTITQLTITQETAKLLWDTIKRSFNNFLLN